MSLRTYKQFIVILIGIFAFNAHAFEGGDWNIGVGTGLNGSRGIMAVSVEKFLTESHVLSAMGGLDLIGATLGAGYKYFGKDLNNHVNESFIDRCFFLVTCKTHPYAGLNLQYANGFTAGFGSNDSTRTYKIDPSWLGMASWGFRDIFQNKMTFDFDLSYRTSLMRGKIRQTAGMKTPGDIRALEIGYDSFGFGIGIGYLF